MYGGAYNTRLTRLLFTRLSTSHLFYFSSCHSFESTKDEKGMQMLLLLFEHKTAGNLSLYWPCYSLPFFLTRSSTECIATNWEKSYANWTYVLINKISIYLSMDKNCFILHYEKRRMRENERDGYLLKKYAITNNE